MLHILLLILKIIGIILLVILGLLSVSSCLVLFAPAHYQVSVKTDDGIKDLTFCLKAHWFLHLISAFVNYKDKEWNWQFKIAWKKFRTSGQKTSDETGNTADVENQEHSEKTENVDYANDAESTDDANEEKVVKNAEDSRKESSTKKTKTKQAWYEKIKCTILKFCDKIKEIWKTQEKITDFLTDEIHKLAFGRVKTEIITLAKRLSPRTLKGYARFGFEDPYNTGRVLAGLSMLYPFYGEKIAIYPEFERKILEADINMKGHMRGIHLLNMVLHLLFDKNIRTTYKHFKSLK